MEIYNGVLNGVTNTDVLKNNGYFIVPDIVTEIADWAFAGCTELKKVIIPDTVTSIGMNTFAGCINLIDVENHANIKNVASVLPKDIKMLSLPGNNYVLRMMINSGKKMTLTI